MTGTPLKLVELLPVATLERLKDLFESTVGVPVVFTDAEGVPLTTVEKPLRFCGRLVHSEALGTVCLSRKKWDAPDLEAEAAMRSAHSGGEPVHHRCRGGFRDSAVPIEVEGQIVGYAVFARSRAEPADVGEFRQHAVAGGMPPEVGEQVALASLVMSQTRLDDVAGFLQVITTLLTKAAYETIRAAQVMELEKLRDGLVHMIVHDLRTPLTGITGGLQLVMDTDYDTEVTQEFVPMALRSANTLIEMVSTLLDINKIESGEMELDLTSVDFGQVADFALDQVRGIAQERGQTLLFEIPADCPPIRADEEKLRQIVVNLVGNAIKFTQDGGEIKLSAVCGEDTLTFGVSDNGPGIPPEDRDRIFEKFGQVESRKSGRKHSTGLGLTFCKMVVEAHGGRIWVDSEVGKGSTFGASIPREV